MNFEKPRRRRLLGFLYYCIQIFKNQNKMKIYLPLFIILLLHLNISAQSLNNNLIAYWPFSGNANDSTGHGLNGVVYNASLVNDRFGNPNNAYYFNGIDARISITNNQMLIDSINGSNKVTICTW